MDQVEIDAHLLTYLFGRLRATYNSHAVAAGRPISTDGDSANDQAAAAPASCVKLSFVHQSACAYESELECRTAINLGWDTSHNLGAATSPLSAGRPLSTDSGLAFDRTAAAW